MVTLRTALFVAYQTITQGSKSTAILLVSILAFSFLNILFISGILGGLGASIVNTFVETGTSHIKVSPQEKPTKKTFIEDEISLRGQIQAIPGVVATARRYALSGTFSYDKEKNGKYKDVPGTVDGIDVDQDAKVFTTSRKVVAGRFLSGTAADEIVIGSGLSGGTTAPTDNDLGGVIVGDKILVTYPAGTRTYTVVGIINVGIGPGNSHAYVTAKEAESVLSVFDSANSLAVKVDLQKNTLDDYAARIRLIAPNLVVKTYKSLMADIGTLLSAFNLISIFVSSIAILVAMITMFALVYVNAVSKRRQIGILRAIGLEPEIIIYSYIFQSLFYTLCGILVGAVLVFGMLQPYLLAHPIQLPFGGTALVLTAQQIVTGIVSLIAAGFLGGLVPSRIVAKEAILTAIWG